MLLTAPYLLAAGAFFATDDWIYLERVAKLPAQQFWRCFSPEVIWFYRPLQTLQFALFYRLWGLNPLPYNLALVLMHLACCALLYSLALRLAGRRGFAAATTLLFAGSWVYIDVLLWKSNFNTLHWALVTLGLLVAYARHLETGSRRWLVLALLLAATSCFTKEMAVVTPALAGMVWIYNRCRRGVRLSRAEVAAAARSVAPFVALTLVYLVLHRAFVRNIYQEVILLYQFAPPPRAAWQVVYFYNHVLLGMLREPFLAGAVPGVRRALVWGLEHLPLALPVGLALAWRLRDRLLAFGLLWTGVTAVPVVLLTTFHSSRFYYVPAMGAALVLARLGERFWENRRARCGAATTALASGAARLPWRRLAVCGLAAYWMVANLALKTWAVFADLEDSRAVQQVFRALAQQGATVPAGALLILRNAPPSYLQHGIGAPEMARLALRNPEVETVLEGQPIGPERLGRIQRHRRAFRLDFLDPHAQLQSARLNVARGSGGETAP